MHTDIAKLMNKIGVLCALVFLYSCITAPENPKADDPDKFIGTGAGLVYLKNPIANGETSTNYDDNTFSRKITDNTTLLEKCSFKQFNFGSSVETNIPCFGVYNLDDSVTTPLESTNGGWTYTFKSDEFYQVNAFYHVKSIMNKFFESMSFAHQEAFQKNFYWTIPSATKFDLASTKGFWLTENDVTKTLKVITKCYQPVGVGPFYSPADKKICMAYNSAQSHIRFVEDPSVIYHEMGHVFIQVLLNQRNTFMDQPIQSPSLPASVTSIPYQASLGQGPYDEAGALGEGISDYFAYYMTNRSTIMEWALGTLGGSARRPITESDSLHHAVFTESEKLSYPRHLHYNANNSANDADPGKESVHNAGQITSHYLVALHNKLKSVCSFDNNSADYKNKQAHNYIIYTLSETLAELGDLTAKGSDFWDNQDLAFTNLNQENAFEWNQSVDTISYRKFYKVFAKNIYHNISHPGIFPGPANGLCPEFTRDESEKLLDQYGLLLFKSYGDKGDGQDSNTTAKDFSSNAPTPAVTPLLVPKNAPTFSFNPLASNTSVNEVHRNNSILISKDLISLPASNATLSTAYLVDSRSAIEAVIASLTFQGNPVATSNGLAGVEYNNNNTKISPGEIVGVSLNLVNNSNSSMAGLQILGNDWDHMKLMDNSKRHVNRFVNKNSVHNSTLAEHRPCRIDGWPLLSEGALEDTTNTQGDCSFNSKSNKKIEFIAPDTDTYPVHALDAPQPICMVKFSADNEQRWVSQNYYRNELNLDDSQCLNNATSGTSFNPNACLVRVLPGASQAFYSKLDSSKTLAQTLTQDGSSLVLSDSHIVLMEINKEVPPGTQFNCRFRARMSNCSDCYDDASGNEYSSSDYTGAAPFKVINFGFTVAE